MKEILLAIIMSQVAKCEKETEILIQNLLDTCNTHPNPKEVTKEQLIVSFVDSIIENQGPEVAMHPFIIKMCALIGTQAFMLWQAQHQNRTDVKSFAE